MQGFTMCMGGTRKRMQGAFAETLEGRRLLSTISWDYTEDPFYGAAATLDVGDNNTSGVYCEAAATVGGSSADGEYEWDYYADDGIDSEWVDVGVSLTVDGTDQIDLTIGSGSGREVSASEDAMTSIAKVVIDASVLNAGLAFSWANISVQFYRDGQLVDSATIATGPQADTMDYTAWSAAEGVQITTAEIGCDEVVITGQVRLQSDSPWFSAQSLFGQVRIYESA